MRQLLAGIVAVAIYCWGGLAMADTLTIAGPARVHKNISVNYTVTAEVTDVGLWSGTLWVDVKRIGGLWTHVSSDYNDGAEIDARLVSPTMPITWTPSLGMHEWTVTLQFQDDENIRAADLGAPTFSNQLDVTVIDVQIGADISVPSAERTVGVGDAEASAEVGVLEVSVGVEDPSMDVEVPSMSRTVGML